MGSDPSGYLTMAETMIVSTIIGILSGASYGYMITGTLEGTAKYALIGGASGLFAGMSSYLIASYAGSVAAHGVIVKAWHLVLGGLIGDGVVQGYGFFEYGEKYNVRHAVTVAAASYATPGLYLVLNPSTTIGFVGNFISALSSAITSVMSNNIDILFEELDDK